MICNIKLTYYFKNSEERNDTEIYLKNNFSVVMRLEETTDGSDKVKESIICNVDCFRVWMNYSRISIDGSLWKFFHGRNDNEFTKEEIFLAHEKLQYFIPTVKWIDSVFTKLHFGPNIVLSQNCDAYVFKILGKKNKKKNLITDKSATLSVGCDSNYMMFYNKTEESKEQLIGNILRIEHRINSPHWRKKNFGDSYPSFGTLLSNLNILPQIWYRYYLSIDKDYGDCYPSVTSVADIKNIAFRSLNYDETVKAIQNSYKTGLLDRNKRNYCMSWVSNINRNNGNDLVNGSLINELDSKVKASINNF